jgi:regulator of RNase E activity RraA
MAVGHGDIVHADRHGAVVIPPAALAELPRVIDLLTRREAVVLEAARAPDFDIAKLRAAWAGQADVH